MPTKKPLTIAASKKLLEANGYTVNKCREDPKIGDVVRMGRDNGDTMDILITFHQTDDATDDDIFDFGGVEVAIGTYDQLYTEPCWIDRDEWAKDDGQYQVVGHVDLSGFTKTYS